MRQVCSVVVAAVVAVGIVAVGPSPAFAASPLVWSGPLTLPSGNVGNGLACRTGLGCVGTSFGTRQIETSTNPGAAAANWTASTFTDIATNLQGISCPSVSLCVAVDYNETVVASTHPTTDAADDWVSSGPITDGQNLTDVSCPSTTLCVAVDTAAGIYHSTFPNSITPPWSDRVQITGSSDTEDAISCPTASLCVAVDAHGHAVVSTDPTTIDGSKWKVTDIDGSNPLFDVSCTAGPMCVAVDYIGNILTSTNPAAVTPSWKKVDADGTNAIYGVSCASSSLCVAVDAIGNALVATNPTGSASAWSKSDLNGPINNTALHTVSCASVSLCVIGDRYGRVWVGKPKSYRPDALIGNWSGGGLIGAKIYSATAAQETINANVTRGHSKAFKIEIKNRGNVADSYLISGTGAQIGWTVTYLHGTTNVTQQVVAGTFKPTVSAGSTVTIKMTVNVPANAVVGFSKSWLVLAKSTGDANKKDAVKATVKATS